MHTLDLEETLPLVYQLLLLSQKGQKGEILRGIVAYYQHLEHLGQEDSVRERHHSHSSIRCSHERSQEPGEDHIRRLATTEEQLRAVEATAMLHISFAVKQDNVGYLPCIFSFPA